MNLKMVSKRMQCQCLVCKKMIGSKNLKRHCKIVHGMDDEECKLIEIKIYSCKYYKKLFTRSINGLYHELLCLPRETVDVSCRSEFQFGAETATNGGFEEIQNGRDQVCVIYRKSTGSSTHKTVTWMILSLL